MNPKHHHNYRAAARQIERGWVRGRFHGSNGRVCLVQALMDNVGSPTLDVITPVHEELCQRAWFYRSFYGLNPRRAHLVRWNDKPWRRQSTVVAVLDTVADRLELAYLRDEVARLEAEVKRLRGQRDASLIEAQRLRDRLADTFLPQFSPTRQRETKLQAAEDSLAVRQDRIAALTK